jgi:hypothetical protein
MNKDYKERVGTVHIQANATVTVQVSLLSNGE